MYPAFGTKKYPYKNLDRKQLLKNVTSHQYDDHVYMIVQSVDKHGEKVEGKKTKYLIYTESIQIIDVNKTITHPVILISSINGKHSKEEENGRV